MIGETKRTDHEPLRECAASLAMRRSGCIGADLLKVTWMHGTAGRSVDHVGNGGRRGLVGIGTRPARMLSAIRASRRGFGTTKPPWALVVEWPLTLADSLSYQRNDRNRVADRLRQPLDHCALDRLVSSARSDRRHPRRKAETMNFPDHSIFADFHRAPDGCAGQAIGPQLAQPRFGSVIPIAHDIPHHTAAKMTAQMTALAATAVSTPIAKVRSCEQRRFTARLQTELA